MTVKAFNALIQMSIERKKRVFICSPFRGEIEDNVKRAKECCRSAIFADVVPIAPHIYFTQFLDDTACEERELGIACGLELLDLCDEVWVYNENGITEGMREEIEYAKQKGIPLIYKSNREAQ